LEQASRQLQVVFNGVVIAETRRALRILETSHPPVYYFPPEDVKLAQYFTASARATFCEWKGSASYYSISVGDKSIPNAAWYYARPAHPYEALAGYVAVYPGKMEACYVDGERVQAQEGDFYGGWITREIVGPFKGGPGSQGW
jgi:uncharacterized protein (DUF427 family)